MNKFHELGGQVEPDNHTHSAADGRANGSLLSNIAMPGQPLHELGGHSLSDNQTRVAADGRATVAMTTIGALPGHPISNGHSPHDVQSEPAVAGEVNHSPSDALSSCVNLAPFSDSQPREVTHTRAAVAGEVNHLRCDTHPHHVDLAPFSDDHTTGVAHRSVVIASEVGHDLGVTHNPNADLAPIIAEIREQWRRRQAWHRAEKSLTLQAKALCRRLTAGDKKKAGVLYDAALGDGDHSLAATALAAILPLVEARDSVEKARKAVQKRLRELAGQLPVAPWVKSVRGFDLPSLAAIVGEAGDLGTYSNPAKLWKRFGLAVMGDGSRQRRVSGVDALEHGYSPSRRSVMWNVGDCLVRASGPLKMLYNERKAIEAERVETKAHAHNRAKRYIEKRLLRELWSAWRTAGGDQVGVDSQSRNVAPAN